MLVGCLWFGVGFRIWMILVRRCWRLLISYDCYDVGWILLFWRNILGYQWFWLNSADTTNDPMICVLLVGIWWLGLRFYDWWFWFDVVIPARIWWLVRLWFDASHWSWIVWFISLLLDVAAFGQDRMIFMIRIGFILFGRVFEDFDDSD